MAWDRNKYCKQAEIAQQIEEALEDTQCSAKCEQCFYDGDCFLQNLLTEQEDDIYQYKARKEDE